MSPIPPAGPGSRSRLVGLLTSLLLAVGCTGTPTTGPSPTGTASRSERSSSAAAPSAGSAAEAGGPAGDLDLTGLPIERAPFCDRLDASSIRELLGGPATATAHYGNGDEVEITPGYVDVAHEYNCTFRRGATSARAWVFAAPVSAARAARLVREAGRRPGCTARPGGSFGTPSVLSVCAPAEPAGTTTTLRGLFGDAWLSCETTLPGPPQEALPRTRSWCVEVAAALGARP